MRYGIEVITKNISGEETFRGKFGKFSSGCKSGIMSFTWDNLYTNKKSADKAVLKYKELYESIEHIIAIHNNLLEDPIVTVYLFGVENQEESYKLEKNLLNSNK